MSPKMHATITITKSHRNTNRKVIGGFFSSPRTVSEFHVTVYGFPDSREGGSLVDDAEGYLEITVEFLA